MIARPIQDTRSHKAVFEPMPCYKLSLGHGPRRKDSWLFITHPLALTSEPSWFAFPPRICSVALGRSRSGVQHAFCPSSRRCGRGTQAHHVEP
jgi:hypothetical protein